MTGFEAAKAGGSHEAGMPRHVAIIMDGNGRWARSRGLPRVEGHRRGVNAVREAVRHAQSLGIEWLTIYSFSSENWSRPLDEVQELMGLLKLFIRRDLADLHKANVRVRVIGERAGLPADIADLLDEAEAKTAENTGLTLVVAFNYGARNEIARAVRALAADVAKGVIDPQDITEASIAGRLDTAAIPDPDLIIRTSGEQRLSNFLMWQAAYAEFVFLPVHWPDFDAKAFDEAISEYQGRERRFGGLTARSAV
ncbi:isoprenyl transferase [Oryzibacter oryziterrae]|uniref:isoprenyl transferase n=1 Tax=Oryzibacter oryziterrae TaxID=2766474 RepID=UPI002103F027|nr:isoprenyl transferase [Oryzibacter oryziterrae]